MALVQIGWYKDHYGRSLPTYKDTDDIDDAEYYYYCRAERLVGIHPKATSLMMKILMDEISASEIESSVLYNFVTDDFSYNMLLLSNKSKAERLKGVGV